CVRTVWVPPSARDTSWRKSPYSKAPDGVSHPQLSSLVQDPGCNERPRTRSVRNDCTSLLELGERLDDFGGPVNGDPGLGVGSVPVRVAEAVIRSEVTRCCHCAQVVRIGLGPQGFRALLSCGGSTEPELQCRSEHNADAREDSDRPGSHPYTPSPFHLPNAL